MIKTLHILGEPPCRTLEEGQKKIIELMRAGKFSEEYLEEIVDYAIDSVKRHSQYKVVFSDSNSSSFQVPSEGFLKIRPLR